MRNESVGVGDRELAAILPWGSWPRVEALALRYFEGSSKDLC